MDGAYHGSVSENGGLVDVSPQIKAKNGPICGYRIVNSHKGKIPFEVLILTSIKYEENSSLVHSHWSRNVEAWLSLDETFEVLKYFETERIY